MLETRDQLLLAFELFLKSLDLCISFLQQETCLLDVDGAVGALLQLCGLHGLIVVGLVVTIVLVHVFVVLLLLLLQVTARGTNIRALERALERAPYEIKYVW